MDGYVTSGADFATKPTLVGELAVLRPFTEADLPAMREALLDPEARILTGSVHDEAQAHAPEPPDEEDPVPVLVLDPEICREGKDAFLNEISHEQRL